MTERRFPVLLSYQERRECEPLGCPRTVPWALVAAHEAQALENHGQTVQRLAERGGMGTRELVAVLTDRHWREVRGMTEAEAVPELLVLLERWRGGAT